MLGSCRTKYLSVKQKISTISKLERMVGTWATYSTVYTMMEIWKKTSDTTLSGRSIMIMTGDTVLNERMSIQPGQSSINLTSKNLSVEDSDFENYKLTKITSDKIMFEKQQAGKPERMTYNFIDQGTLRILFETNGKSIEGYNMKKIIKK
jgi:hypothetical protein